ncbi:MAG: TetR/AcrR family transcriptional regulator, partial [Burkholderiales bacterium]
MGDALRTRGYHGVGLNELLAAAQAPKGVLYHHFPGGKAELAVCAIESVVAKLCIDLDKALQRTG